MFFVFFLVIVVVVVVIFVVFFSSFYNFKSNLYSILVLKNFNFKIKKIFYLLFVRESNIEHNFI